MPALAPRARSNGPRTFQLAPRGWHRIKHRRFCPVRAPCRSRRACKKGSSAGQASCQASSRMASRRGSRAGSCSCRCGRGTCRSE
eukprot:scaffold80138_cov63-Phaeocystis_antarctica.AAC.2